MVFCNDIKKDYKNGSALTEVLKGVSLSFQNKGFYTILGPSGCGKTTLLNIIGLLSKPSSGSVMYGDVNASSLKGNRLDSFRRHKVGYIRQEYDLIPDATVLHNAVLPGNLGTKTDNTKARAISLLTKLGLKDKAYSKANTLSGGEKERVAIVRALLNDPDIILADEPTGALDSENTIEIMDILKDISKERLVIMVSHNEELSTMYSDFIIRMKDGMIISNSEQNIEIEKQIKKAEQKKDPLSFIRLASANFIRGKKSIVLMALINLIGIGAIGSTVAIKNGEKRVLAQVDCELMEALPIEISPYYIEALNSLGAIVSDGTEFSNTAKVKVQEKITSITQINDLTKSYRDYLKNNLPAGTLSERYALSATLIGLDSSGTAYSFEASSQSMVASFMSTFSMEGSSVSEMPFDKERVLERTDILQGRYPNNKNEAVLVIDSKNSISSDLMKMLGFKNDEVSFDSIVGKSFKFAPNDSIYVKNAKTISVEGYYLKDQADIEASGLTCTKVETYLLNAATSYMSGDTESVDKHMSSMRSMFKQDKETKTLSSYSKIENPYSLKDIYNDTSIGENLVITGILRRKKDSLLNTLNPGIYYGSDTTQMFIEGNKNSAVAKEMYNHLVYQDSTLMLNVPEMYSVINSVGKQSISSVSEAITTIYSHFEDRQKVGSDITPSSLNLIPHNKQEKEAIIKTLDDYNKEKTQIEKIEYLDVQSTIEDILQIYVDVLDSILRVLIILVVSSMLIINCLVCLVNLKERKWEIGLYRSLGGSKSLVASSMLFEKFLMALSSSLVGTITTFALIAIINNSIQKSLTTVYIPSFAFLTFGGFILVTLVSTAIILISTVIPVIIASSKDPSDVIRER